ncbi:MAG: sigma-E factor negative regulatory protein, partial [Methylotenera sp.]
MNEQISALLDGEVALEDASHLITSVQSNRQAAETWSQYHLIGDTMRDTPSFSANFKQNLMLKLDQEPTVLSPNAALTN